MIVHLLHDLRKNIEKKRIKTPNEEFGVTVSVGVYMGFDLLDNMIKAADEMLYEAKESGRNKVVTKIEV